MPPILKNTLQFSAFLLIGLSMFVAVEDIWLALLFTASIATLAFSIFLVLLDLDNPLEPGDWNITSKSYRKLLEKIGDEEVQ
jgi:sugar phosphate permease